MAKRRLTASIADIIKTAKQKQAQQREAKRERESKKLRDRMAKRKRDAKWTTGRRKPDDD